MDSIIDAYGTRKKNEVMFDTWGHLAPKPQKKYYCTLVIAIGEDGDRVTLKNDLPGSPWHYDDTEDFLGRSSENLETGVHRFIGWYKKFKNNNYCFGGGKWETANIQWI